MMVSETKMTGLLASIVVLFFLGLVRSNPTYSDTGHYNATEDHPFSFKCPTDQSIVSWKKNGEVVSYFKTLNFLAISRTEAGYYSCYVLRTKKPVDTIYINVQYPAKILQVSKQPSPLHANQTYSISVDVEGNPSPNTTLASEEDGRLVFKHGEVGKFDITMGKVQCADGGTYQLKSQNTLGDDTRDEEILVFCPPSPSSRLPIHDKLEPRIGDNVTLKVVSMGYPYPNYTWTHEGNEVHSMNKHFESDVELKSFAPEEFGEYTLTMTNDLGETNHTFHVIADGPPGQVADLKVVGIMETSVNLSWVSGFDYGHNQSYTVMSYNKGKYTDIASFNAKEDDHGFSNVSHVIENLQSGLMYNFSVAAKNSKGEGPMSPNSVAFTTAPYKEYTVVEGGSVFLVCNGTLPGDHVYWSTESGAIVAEGKQLAIFNTTRNYTGMYICNDVVKTTIIIKETVFLNVQYPEKILDVKVPSEDVNVNGTYVIMVNVEGNPTPTTTITQHGNVLFQANTTGMFNASVDHVTCSEFGTINLTCSNTLGNETKTEVMLVHCPPSPKGTVHTKFQPRLGENVTLHIDNIGYPYPVYTWTFNGKILKNKTSDDVDDYNVKTVKIADFGLYKLVMSNALGSSAVNYSLEAYGPPDPVTQLGVNNITTSTANITFESGFDYGAHQNFIIQTFNGKTYEDIASFDDKSKDHNPANVSYVMSDLEVGTKYNFSIVANNSRGRGERSIGFVAFTTDEPRNTFVVVEGNNFTVACNASAGMSDVHWENDHDKRVGSGKIFTIANVNRLDGGYYKCIGMTEKNVKHNLDIIFLDVHYSAKILSLNTSDQYMHVNDTFFVWVEEEGRPPTHTVLTKLRDGSMLFPGDGNFTIDDVQCTDTAKYLLNVSNEVGSDTAELEMFVYCPPTIDPHANNTRKFYPRLGDLTTLQIQDYGYPYPNHSWTYNFTTLHHNDTNISSEITVTSSMNDYGSYNAIMDNEFGSINVGFDLIEAGPPDAVSELKRINYTYNSVALSWRSGFDYNSKQTFMVMTTAGKSLQNFTDATRVHEMAVYTVTGLASSTGYNLTVVSRNVDGNSDTPKGSVFFTTAAAPAPHKGNNHTGAIVGGVIGAVCVVAILVAAGIFLKRRRDRQMNYQNIDEDFN